MKFYYNENFDKYKFDESKYIPNLTYADKIYIIGDRYGHIESIIEENDEMVVHKIKIGEKWNVTWNKKSKVVGDYCYYIRSKL